MSFPACAHARKKTTYSDTLRWLGAEPYRLFFPSAVCLGIAGALLWPLFYAQHLSFYPGISHARVMVEGFAGGFIFGFLGTAGPRMLSAPKLTPLELITFVLVHLAAGVCHLAGRTTWGDALFFTVLLGFCASLVGRGLFLRKEDPPPPMLLTLLGLGCGVAGTALWLSAASLASAQRHRLASLLLYHGFVLGPIMGAGAFLFRRLLGGNFGEPVSPDERRRLWLRTVLLAVGLLSSFVVEVWLSAEGGVLLRVVTFLVALSGTRWRRAPDAPPAGTLANALRGLCLPLAALGIGLPAVAYVHHVGLEHLLFVSGFGLLCLIVGSRVLFGHSGALPDFARRSGVARTVVALVVVAALTRASTELWPKLLVTHHIYAALLWALAAGIWIVWHGRRFFRKDVDED